MLCNYIRNFWLLLFCSFIFSFSVTIVSIDNLILFFKKKQIFQPIRSDGSANHLITKQQIPTFGGIVTSLTIFMSSILFTKGNDIHINAIILLSIVFSITGFIDDFIKVFYKNTNGFKGSIKICIQIFFTILILLWLYEQQSEPIRNSNILIPFIHKTFSIGTFILPFYMFVIVGSGNSVNLTDGLDGLVIVPIIISAFVFGIISLNQNFVYSISEINLSQISILCSSMIGTGLGFFYFNKHPAKIFMGDVGSLMYGSMLGFIAIIMKQEFFYAIMGLLFVIEAISDIIQVISYKLTKKRFFLMSPLHHHFEKKGFPETKITKSFWLFFLFSTLVAILGIIKFKFI